MKAAEDIAFAVGVGLAAFISIVVFVLIFGWPS
ncbi:MAG: hypothetical protein JWO28_2126 [Hyphomicrobiales bacterium]|nr:hypothetical protein [Hyphomicrobiales bacterium]